MYLKAKKSCKKIDAKIYIKWFISFSYQTFILVQNQYHIFTLAILENNKSLQYIE